GSTPGAQGAVRWRNRAEYTRVCPRGNKVRTRYLVRAAREEVKYLRRRKVAVLIGPEPGATVPEPEAQQPGKTRTWWHPLLVSVLRWQLGDHYRVEEKVNVGQKPLQIDVLLLRQQAGELPESVRQIMAGLVEYLNELTLLEFKSPSDALRAGDFQTFLAYALLYRTQNQPL